MATQPSLYFNAYNDLKDWNKNDAFTNAGLVLKVASYATIAIPIIIATYNLCTTGNLSGLVKPITVPSKLDEATAQIYEDTIAAQGSKITLLEEQVANLQTQIASMKSSSPGSGNIESFKVQLQNLTQQLQQAKLNTSNKDAQIKKLEELIAKLKTQITIKASSSSESGNTLQNESLTTQLEQANTVIQELDKQVTTQGKEIAKLKAENNQKSFKEIELKDQLAKVTQERDLEADKAKSQQKRADTLLARAGKNHIKRDWQQSTLGSIFPAGEDFSNEFVAAFVNVESFGCDVINVLEEKMVEETPNQIKATKMFVHEIMKPLHKNCQKFITDYLNDRKAKLEADWGVELNLTNADEVNSLFWFKSMQPAIIKMVEKLTDEDIEKIIDNEMIMTLHQNMLNAAENDIIDKGETNLRIPQLTRHLLRLIAIAEMSDPKCYLGPIPGERLVYKEDLNYMQEILSPGVKRYGRIKEGDEVEVVSCGLYFDPYKDTDGKFIEKDGKLVKPVKPCLVRRIPKQENTKNS